jgi:SUMO ligase MMS21 Smc5/6 complex component
VAVDDGEEELQITGGKLDTRCPLSMTELTEPYTSKRCKHSFQKDAILEFIRMWRPGVQGNRCMCPVVGCDKEIKKEDLYHDKVLLRRIERQRAADEQDERSSDEEEEATLVDGNGVVPKTSPKTAVKRERRQDDDMED